jgi:hypothetical protein
MTAPAGGPPPSRPDLESSEEAALTWASVWIALLSEEVRTPTTPDVVAAGAGVKVGLEALAGPETRGGVPVGVGAGVEGAEPESPPARSCVTEPLPDCPGRVSVAVAVGARAWPPAWFVIAVGLGVGVTVDVEVPVGVIVTVAVLVAVGEGICVEVAVGDAELADVGMGVAVLVEVAVAVGVGVSVGVEVGVLVLVGVAVGVAV